MKYPIYQFLFLVIILLTSSVSAQDKIYLKSGENIDSKILEVNINDVKYKKLSNLEGPLYTIVKSDIHMVIYENGESEIFTSNNSNEIDSSSIEKTKAFIVSSINKYGSSLNGANPFKASFEGDYLRIRETNRNRTSYIHDMGVFDFSNVYKFDRISYRNYQKAFINIWVLNKRKKNWTKEKLVIRVMGHNNAREIMDALKVYNKLMIEKK